MKSKNKYSRKMIFTLPFMFLIVLVSFADKAECADCTAASEATEIFYGDTPENLTSVCDKIFFTTNNNTWLWVSDGSQDGAVLLQRFDEDIPVDISIQNLINVEGTLFFILNKDSYEDDWIITELWKSDGTPEGTTSLQDVDGAPGDFTVVGNTLFFTSEDHPPLEDSDETQEDVKKWLWKSDGSTDGTVKVREFPHKLVPQRRSNSHFSYFLENHETGFSELWTMEATAPGPGRYMQAIQDFRVVNNTGIIGATLFFGTNSSNHEKLQLWRVRDRTGMIYKLTDIPGDSSILLETAVVGDTLYFTIVDSKTRVQTLWKSDGTEDGTTIVQSFEDNHIRNLTGVDHTLYFSSEAGDTGNALWQSNGTPEGTTVIVQNINNPIEGIIQVTGQLRFYTFGNASDEDDGMYAKDLYRYSAEEGAVNVFSSVDIFAGDYGDFELEANHCTGNLFFALSDSRIHMYGSVCDD